jgi:hypothetical protein
VRAQGSDCRKSDSAACKISSALIHDVPGTQRGKLRLKPLPCRDELVTPSSSACWPPSPPQRHWVWAWLRHCAQARR